MELAHHLKSRFLRYVAIPSQSNDKIHTVPSSEGQRELAQLLMKELQTLGVHDIELDSHSILTAKFSGNPDLGCIGFVAHLDTVDVGLSPIIKPQLIRYKGGDVILNQEKNIVLRCNDYPEIQQYIGQDIFFSDGTSVLGADDKASISVLMQLAERMQTETPLEKSQRPDIILAFVPDEEIGLRGSKHMNLERFKVDFAYTIDCCELGEMIFETFNAAHATLTIEGVTAHPMNAKGILLNPILLAQEFIAQLNPLETPEHTEGKEGYIWVNEIHGQQKQCIVDMDIRDFDLTRFEEKQNRLYQITQTLQNQYPKAHISLKITQTYQNISRHLTHNHPCIQILHKAFKAAQVTPKLISMRGGTDGSALSAKGIACPNFFTGAHHFHSHCEYLPISSFIKSYEVAQNIVWHTRLDE